MALSYRNRAQILANHPEIGQAFDDIVDMVQRVSDQTNSSPLGVTAPPPAPSALTVTASQGVFDCKITDRNPVNRGIHYFLEYSPSLFFNAPRTIDLGQSRNHRVFLGNGTFYWRAHSSYPTSARSEPVYHGSSGAPLPVQGGGVIAGPTLQDSEGSGTTNGPTGSDGAFGNNPSRLK